MVAERRPITLQQRVEGLPLVSRGISAVDRIKAANEESKIYAEVQRAQQVSGLRRALEQKFLDIENPEDYVLKVPLGVSDEAEFLVDFLEDGSISLLTEVSEHVKDRNGDRFLDTSSLELVLGTDNMLSFTSTINEHSPRGLRDSFAIGDYPADPRSTSFDPAPKDLKISTTDIARIKIGVNAGSLEKIEELKAA